MKNNYIDLFSGAGGLGEGFQNNSFSPVYINDMDSWALKTCQLRKAYHKLLSINEDDIYYDYIQKNPGDKPEFFDPTDFIKNDKRLSYIIDSLSSDEELHQDNLSTHFSTIF